MCKVVYYFTACGHDTVYDERGIEYCQCRPVSPYSLICDLCVEDHHYEQVRGGPDPQGEFCLECTEWEYLEFELDEL